MDIVHRDSRRAVEMILFISIVVLVSIFAVMSFVGSHRILGRLVGIDSSPAPEAPDPERLTPGPREGSGSHVASSPPPARGQGLSTIGLGTGLVFSPDFSEPRNRALYEALGFAYFEGTSWSRIFDEIRAFNAAHRDHPIRVLILETHGTEGHGLKLQASKDPAAGRSYVSVGGLQQSLEGTGVKTVLLSACNSGRLFRPEIYKRIDRDTKNHLFLPATEGFVDATEDFDVRRSLVLVLRRSDSNLESLVHADTSELAPSVRAVLARSSTQSFDKSGRFAVSTMLIQILLRDPRLHLRKGGSVAEVSRNDLSTEEIEALFQRFLAFLESNTKERGSP